MKLIEFIANQWKEPQYRKKLENKILYVISGSRCTKISMEGAQDCQELLCTQEEADTRILLHCQHASNMYPSIIVSAEDTDVFIFCLAFQGQLGAYIFIKCGTATRTRLIDIRKITNVLGQKVCEALLGMHAFTGCDSVSAFSGRGKVKALKPLMDNENFQDTFRQIGEIWTLSPDILLSLEEITCNLYVSHSNIKCVNEMRYNLFRHKNSEIDSSQSPPCKDSLQLHIIRVNYQAAIWKRSLFCNPGIPSPLKAVVG